MKIAFIGQKSIKSLETDLATQFVQAGHTTNLYLNRKKSAMQVNGMKVQYSRLLLCVVHALVVFRADVIVLRGEAKKYRRIISLFAPDVYLYTDALQQGVYVKRFAVSDVILQAHHLRSGEYAVIDKNIELSPDVLKKIEKEFGSSFPFIVIDENKAHREVVRTVMGGSAFVVTNRSILEAMSYGKPVITERKDLSSDVMDIVLSYQSDEECSAIMAQLIADPMLRAGLGHVGREYAEGFTWQQVAYRYLDAWKRAVEQRSGRFGIIQSYVKR